MKEVFVFIVLSYVVHSKALECGILNLNNDHFKEVMTECIKDNETLNKILDMTSGGSIEETESSMSSEEKKVEKKVPMTRGMVNNKNVKMTKARSKRSRFSKFNDISSMSNDQRKHGGSSTTTEESTTISENESEDSSENNNIGDSDEMCIIQCVLEKLELTDSNGVPNHNKLADALLKSARGRQMRDFVQESTDDCFQQVDQEDSENTCQYSTMLMTCLADKGKSNCEDWPAGNIPLF